MNREYILRDGEIAVNLPNGTTTIMNINTYMDLQTRLKGESEEVKELRKELLEANRKAELYKARHDELVINFNKKVDEVNTLKENQARNFETIKNLRKDCEDLQKKLNEPTEIPLVEDYGQMPSARKPQSGMVYITDDGRVFANQSSVEKFLNLKYHGEVSEYCNNRRKSLRDKNGKDHGLVVWSWNYVYGYGRKNDISLRRYLQAVNDARCRLKNQSK